MKYVHCTTVGLLLAGCVLISGCGQPLKRHDFNRPIMGTYVRAVVYAESETDALRAFDAAYARLEQLNAVMSDYDRTSELSRLSASSGRGEAVHVSDDLWKVLDASVNMSRASGGAFDVTVGPMVVLWRRARRLQQLPAPRRIEAAKQAVGYQHVKLDAARKTVTLQQSDMRLDLGGIAKGYAAQEALAEFTSRGLPRTMVDLGGDLVVGQAPPGRDGWRIGIAPLGQEDGPSRFLMLTNAAVATSGDAWQHVEIDGVRYSHIVDPKTGLGLTHRAGVTVVAPDGMLADALASAVSVLGPTRGLALVEATDGAAALIVQPTPNGVVAHESSRMKRLPIAPPKPPGSADDVSNPPKP